MRRRFLFSAGLISAVCVLLVAIGANRAESQSRSGLAATPATHHWHGGLRAFRVRLQVSAAGFTRTDKVAEHDMDLAQHLTEGGGSGTVDLSSLLLTEVTSTGDLIDGAVVFQFDDPTLVWMVSGNTGPAATRYFDLYFDTIAFTSPSFADSVVVVDGLMDEGQVSFGIATSTATYFFQQEGAGFSSLLDTAGNDWIKYSTADGSAGEFRGIPNLVFPANIFHPGFTGASSTLLHDGPIRATVESPSDDGTFKTRWDFYHDHALLTVVEATGTYWFLYEGTPGGFLNRDAPNNDFLVRSDGTLTSVADTWTDGLDIPGDEWVYFGDPIVDKSLFLVHHTNDELTDWYAPLDLPAGGPDTDWMTVFGFGRQETNSLLSGAGRQFTIGLMDGTDFPTAQSTIESAYKPLSITVGAGESSDCGDGIISGAEECDDGNAANGDGCDSRCRDEVCGNGVDQFGEECDDGNTDDLDACGNDCVANVCGDGELNNGEQCEDGGSVDGDGCDSGCFFEVCGNGITQVGEQCDDGNLIDDDACGDDCIANVCGDGEVNNGELCDDGNSNNDDACRNNCEPPRCGDAIIDDGELCDDGNTDDLDACGNDCMSNFCGDGEVNNGELCDDGNLIDDDECSNDCQVLIMCDNAIRNGDFADGTTEWRHFTNGTGNFTVVNGEGRVRVITTGTNVQLYEFNVSVEGDTTYRLRLSVRSTTGSDVDVRFQQHVDPFELYGLNERLFVTTQMEEYILIFTTPSGDRSDGRLMFQLGRFDQPDSYYYFDDIFLERLDDCPYCGDEIVGIGEDCDDGNLDDDDGCRNSCKFPGCGDGVLDAGEECDDGNTAGGDGCDAVCLIERCGNGTIEGAEECDDGNTTDGDGCDADCVSEICGNGLVQAGEQCDDGNTAAGDGCDAGCIDEVCGNGALQAGEQCDDGNTEPGDGCDAECVDEVCGNGLLQAGEQCDDGNTDDGDGCDAACVDEVCGNGAVQSGEQCDDGNTDPGDGCDAQCVDEVCGNGVLQSGEQCDDGNTDNGDGCDADCIDEVCGNGVVQAGEQCDDGNMVDDDDCRNDCTNAVCGDGRVDPPEECDDANLDDLDACGNDCLLNVCGDGVANNGEDCDDGNLENNDACRNDCTLNPCGPVDNDGDGINDLCDSDDDDDGVLDEDDCAPLDDTIAEAALEVPTLTVIQSDQTILLWSGMGPGVTYDLIAGDPLDLGVDGGVETVTCVAAQTTNPMFMTSATDVAPGEALYYLVRGRNACGPGTFGFGTFAERTPPSVCD